MSLAGDCVSKPGLVIDDSIHTAIAVRGNKDVTLRFSVLGNILQTSSQALVRVKIRGQGRVLRPKPLQGSLIN
jgi:hypothetical protein